eukprot:11156511-Lingulodinium_polyedra.AAC.1
MQRQAHGPQPVPTEAVVSLAGTSGRSLVSASCDCRTVQDVAGLPRLRIPLRKTRTEIGAGSAVMMRSDRRTLFQKS